MREPDENTMDENTTSSVPAGGAGADSGAVDAVGISRGDTADIQNVASVNDIPGVGTRKGDGTMASANGPDAGPSEGGRQTTPRLAQNAPTVEEQLDGIVTQTRADLGAVSESRARSVLTQRLADAGIRLAEDEVEALVERVTAPRDAGSPS